MSEAKFIGYFRLLEACAAPGCPVCECVVAESRSYLHALLYEQVTDPDTRRAVRASWGFCNWHAWMLLEIEHSIFGSAIIYEDLMRLALKRTERLADHAERPRRGWLSTLIGSLRRSSAAHRYRDRAACPVCTAAADTERRYLDTLVRFVGDGDLCAAYTRSDGLCVPHLFAALEGNGQRPGAARLVAETCDKWRRLGRDLSSFVAKHDYRNREPYTGAEATSYSRAFATLAGARGVFGNDLHARRPGPGAARRRRTGERVP